MEINNWFDFALSTVFTLGVIFVLLPMGINFSFSAIKYIFKNGFRKFPESINTNAYGKYPLELLFVGVFSLSFSIWFLFIDQGGNLYMYYTEVTHYITEN